MATIPELLSMAVQNFRSAQLPQAEQACRQILQTSPQHPDAWHLLGLIVHQAGNSQEAVECIRRATEFRPDYVEAHNNLGNVFKEEGQLDEAAASYRRALQISPDYAETLINLGAILQEQGNLDEAEAGYRRALQIRPGLVEAHNGLGSTLKARGKIDEAVASYQRALQLSPDFADAHVNLGNMYQEYGKLDEAVTCYRQAIAANANLAPAHYNLACVLQAQGKVDEAAAAYDRVLQLRPDDKLRYELATLLPMIYKSLDEVDHYRKRVIDNLAAMIDRRVQFDPATDVLPAVFHLAYQGYDDRRIQQTISRLFREPAAAATPRQRDGRIHVGFVSRYFMNHTIGRLMRGTIAHLSREKFRVSVFSLGVRTDRLGRWIEEHADNYIVLGENLSPARKAIVAEKLDLLFYTDIGMCPRTTSLARTRMAPIQCATWGHPVTTGMPTMDYFISSELFEPEDAEEHYTEELVKLQTLTVYYYRPEIPQPLKPRDYFGLSEDRHIYLCPQTLFKFHPDFDHPLAEILRRDPAGEVVLIEAAHSHCTDLLRNRLQAAAPDVADRIRFLPRWNVDDFINLMAVSDVLLDTLHFGGGNTTMESLSMGTPVVTLPSAYLKGRITYGCYRKIGVLDCVASDIEQYIEIAVRLGTDRDYHEMIRNKIRAAADVLFEDLEAVHELEAFFQQAVDRRRADS